MPHLFRPRPHGALLRVHASRADAAEALKLGRAEACSASVCEGSLVTCGVRAME